jgi:hypothetical protein
MVKPMAPTLPPIDVFRRARRAAARDSAPEVRPVPQITLAGRRSGGITIQGRSKHKPSWIAADVAGTTPWIPSNNHAAMPWSTTTITCHSRKFRTGKPSGGPCGAGEKASLAKIGPLSGRDLHWCRWHLGLAILRRGNQANNCSKGAGTWLVAGGQADDRELGPAAWLDEAARRSRNHCCSAVRVGDAASGNRCSDCARDGSRRKRPPPPSLDPEQVHQMVLDLAALRQTVEQLGASQVQMGREMARLQSALVDILVKMPEPPLQTRRR